MLSRLPDELLELCLAACPEESRGSLRLVCKHLKRVCDGSAGFYQLLSLDNAKAADGRDPAALERVSCLPFLEACVSMEVPGALDAALQLTGVTRLSLSGSHDIAWLEEWGDANETTHGEVLAQHPLSLQAFTQLRSLELEIDFLQPSTCAQLSALTGLQYLICGAFDGRALPRELWASLACLPQLEELHFSMETPEGGPCHIPSVAWEALQGCTQLSCLELHHAYVTDGRGFFDLAPGIASLTSLRHLRLDGSFTSFGDMWSHPTLTSLELEDATTADLVMPMDVDMPALRRLAIEADYGGFPNIPAQVTQLSAMTALRLSAYDISALEGAHLWQMPGLASLDINGYSFAGGVVPQCVVQLTKLQALNLGYTELHQLPDGPYLGGLRTLLLTGNKDLIRLPPVLQQAKQLEVLDMHLSQPNQAAGVQIQLEDLTLLQQMPALRVLCMPDVGINWHLAMLLHTWLPHLTCHDSYSVTDMHGLFPNGWDGGINADMYIECLEDDREHSNAMRNRVLASLE